VCTQCVAATLVPLLPYDFCLALASTTAVSQCTALLASCLLAKTAVQLVLSRCPGISAGSSDVVTRTKRGLRQRCAFFAAEGLCLHLMPDVIGSNLICRPIFSAKHSESCTECRRCASQLMRFKFFQFADDESAYASIDLMDSGRGGGNQGDQCEEYSLMDEACQV